MKNANRLLLLCYLLAFVVLASSCTEDACENITCQNAGTCIEGICDCAVGFEGADCSQLWRNKMLGKFGAIEQCSVSGYKPYTTTISASNTADDKILISNLYGTFTDRVVATVTEENKFIINEQELDDYTIISGTGTLTAEGALITITFEITDGLSTESCFVTIEMT